MEPCSVLGGGRAGEQDAGLPAVAPVVEVSRPQVIIQHECDRTLFRELLSHGQHREDFFFFTSQVCLFG